RDMHPEHHALAPQADLLPAPRPGRDLHRQRLRALRAGQLQRPCRPVVRLLERHLEVRLLFWRRRGVSRAPARVGLAEHFFEPASGTATSAKATALPEQRLEEIAEVLAFVGEALPASTTSPAAGAEL